MRTRAGAYPHDHLVFTGPIAETDVTFVGQPATDRDCDMDQVVARALATCHRDVARLDGAATARPEPCDPAVSGGR